MTDKLDISGIENKLDEAMQLSLKNLTDEQQEQLSKVLFPETHTETVDLCGKSRQIFPLTAKYARKIHVQAKPLMEQAIKANEGEDVLVLDEPLLECLYNTSLTIAEAHDDWGDVVKKIKEEDVVIEELQNLIVQQEALQGANDFLLTPLRLALKLMRTREVAEILEREDLGGSLRTMRSAAKSSTAASTS